MTVQLRGTLNDLADATNTLLNGGVQIMADGLGALDAGLMPMSDGAGCGVEHDKSSETIGLDIFDDLFDMLGLGTLLGAGEGCGIGTEEHEDSCNTNEEVMYCPPETTTHAPTTTTTTSTTTTSTTTNGRCAVEVTRPACTLAPTEAPPSSCHDSGCACSSSDTAGHEMEYSYFAKQCKWVGDTCILEPDVYEEMHSSS